MKNLLTFILFIAFTYTAQAQGKINGQDIIDIGYNMDSTQMINQMILPSVWFEVSSESKNINIVCFDTMQLTGTYNSGSESFALQSNTINQSKFNDLSRRKRCNWYEYS